MRFGIGVPWLTPLSSCHLWLRIAIIARDTIRNWSPLAYAVDAYVVFCARIAIIARLTILHRRPTHTPLTHRSLMVQGLPSSQVSVATVTPPLEHTVPLILARMVALTPPALTLADTVS